MQLIKPCVIHVKICFIELINYEKTSVGPTLIKLLRDQSGCWGPNNLCLLHLITPDEIFLFCWRVVIR